MSSLTRHFFEIELAKHIPPGCRQDVDDQETVQIRVRIEDNLCSNAVCNDEHHHDDQEVQQVNELQLHTETHHQNISKLKRILLFTVYCFLFHDSQMAKSHAVASLGVKGRADRPGDTIQKVTPE